MEEQLRRKEATKSYQWFRKDLTFSWIEKELRRHEIPAYFCQDCNKLQNLFPPLKLSTQEGCSKIIWKQHFENWKNLVECIPCIIFRKKCFQKFCLFSESMQNRFGISCMVYNVRIRGISPRGGEGGVLILWGKREIIGQYRASFFYPF